MFEERLSMMQLLQGSRLLGTLLVLSLGLNLFLLGGWVATALAPPRFPPPRGMMERVAQLLSPADAAILRQAFEPIEIMAATSRAPREKVEAALRAEPFDRNALADALRRETSAREAFAHQLEAALLGAAEKMSPDGRHAVARAMLRPPPP